MQVEVLLFIKLFRDSFDIILLQVEVLSGEVLRLVRLLLCLRDDAVATRQAPVLYDLTCRLIVLLCKLCNQGVTLNIGTYWTRFAANAPQRTISNRHHIIIQQELYQVFLSTLWVQTDLVADWLDVCVGQ